MNTAKVDKTSAPEGAALPSESSELLRAALDNVWSACKHSHRTIVVPDEFYDDMVQALANEGLHVTTILRGGKDQLTVRHIPSWMFRSS